MAVTFFTRSKYTEIDVLGYLLIVGGLKYAGCMVLYLCQYA